MDKRVGLWFDHNKAVIVSISDNGEDRRRIIADMDHYIRFSSNTPGDGLPEDVRDRRYWNHLNEYYAKVIAYICDAQAIQIFGPGEAKHELKKRLENEGMAEHTVRADNAGELTDHQIAVKVRERFPARSQYDIS